MRGSLGFGIGIGLTRILGSGDGVVTTTIFNDSNIVITFSEAVQPATVTNVGDGTGSFELYNDTQESWVAGVLSTSDNIQWTFNPTVDFTVGDSLTLHLKDTILTVVGSNSYEGPFEFKYRVVNRLPLMTAFTCDPTSNTANIGVLTATGTDLDSHAITFGISMTDSSGAIVLWQDEAAWQASGFDTGLPAESVETVTLYCFAQDSVGGISSVSISDTCLVDMTAPTIAPDEYWSFETDLTADIGGLDLTSVGGTAQGTRSGEGVLVVPNVKDTKAFALSSDTVTDVTFSLVHSPATHTDFNANGRQDHHSLISLVEDTVDSAAVDILGLLTFSKTTLRFSSRDTLGALSVADVSPAGGLVNAEPFLVIAWRDGLDLNVELVQQDGTVTTGFFDGTGKTWKTSSVAAVIGGTYNINQGYCSTDYIWRPRIWWSAISVEERSALKSEFLATWGI